MTYITDMYAMSMYHGQILNVDKDIDMTRSEYDANTGLASDPETWITRWLAAREIADTLELVDPDAVQSPHDFDPYNYTGRKI